KMGFPNSQIFAGFVHSAHQAKCAPGEKIAVFAVFAGKYGCSSSSSTRGRSFPFSREFFPSLMKLRGLYIGQCPDRH
ncbi:hypothetical protein, partial [Paenibacillus cisolokensis]|uniref:hypothetical protein n=1 Tax=Paenibacillus cisolokensis TaxID=1658519 RepID=UPI001BD0B9A9